MAALLLHQLHFHQLYPSTPTWGVWITPEACDKAWYHPPMPHKAIQGPFPLETGGEGPIPEGPEYEYHRTSSSKNSSHPLLKNGGVYKILLSEAQDNCGHVKAEESKLQVNPPRITALPWGLECSRGYLQDRNWCMEGIPYDPGTHRLQTLHNVCNRAWNVLLPEDAHGWTDLHECLQLQILQGHRKCWEFKKVCAWLTDTCKDSGGSIFQNSRIPFAHGTWWHPS